jgi:glycosyltransferase involved in cell wall biosynthesis
VIFTTSPPHSAALTGTLLNILTKKPLILDYRDDWIDTPSFLSKPQIARMIERKLEKWVVKRADKVILVTEWSRDAFLNRYPSEPEDKFVFVPNGCDLHEFKQLRGSAIKSPNSKFTIIHAGLLNDAETWTRSPTSFFQAIYRILQRPEMADNLSVLFTGRLPESYRTELEKLGLTDVIKEIGHVPRDEFLELMASSDLLLAINYEGFATLIPGKIYEYWAVGGPPILLLSCKGAAQELVENKELGIALPHDDVSAIEEAILRLYQLRLEGKPMKANMLGIEKYDRKSIAMKLSQLLTTVVLE